VVVCSSQIIVNLTSLGDESFLPLSQDAIKCGRGGLRMVPRGRVGLTTRGGVHSSVRTPILGRQARIGPWANIPRANSVSESAWLNEEAPHEHRIEKNMHRMARRYMDQAFPLHAPRRPITSHGAIATSSRSTGQSNATRGRQRSGRIELASDWMDQNRHE
jgi:hypothetical protein